MKQRFHITQCGLADIRDFVERHHYSKSVKGLTPEFCFKVEMDGVLVGAAIFGRPAMRQTINRYSEYSRVRLTELRRFCMIDNTPRNSESFILGVMFRILRKNGIERILSYADPNYGHVGTIYKATGFHCLGQTAPVISIVRQDRKYSTRAIQKAQVGGFPFAHKLLTEVGEGTAEVRKEAGKFIYVKDLVPLADRGAA